MTDHNSTTTTTTPSRHVGWTGTSTTEGTLLSTTEHRAYVLNDFCADAVRLVRLYNAAVPDKSPLDVAQVVPQLYPYLTTRATHQLAGMRVVPTPFFSHKGRTGTFVVRTDAGTEKELSETVAQETLKAYLQRALAQPAVDDVDWQESPYRAWATFLQRRADETVTPTAQDVIVVETAAADQEQDVGNKVIFNMAATLVGTYTTTTAKRVEAALTILTSLDGDNKDTPPPARFLIRHNDASWSVMDPLPASLLVLAFCFEVYLEKGIHMNDVPAVAHAEVPPSSGGAIHDPDDYDVLFGRGGLTNAHPGNRRFRDVIALHRPDYVRAIKMDKPAVARKIVRSIRVGTPPGRFLKKSDDGKWYDVGDRTAAEKTSQGLRERSNAEKRQRHAVREALRVRKQDLEADGKKPAASSTTPGPLPILNYVGTNLAVPLSMGIMNPPPNNMVKRRKTDNGAVSDELNTEGLPPNAVDEDGNILVTDHDILCGRGGLTNHHKGNKRFRDVVALHRPDYVRAPKIQKPSVARVIVRAIRNGDPPGRFLRKDEKTGKWVDIGDKKAAEKTSQALREKTTEEREKLKSHPGAQGGTAATTGISLLPFTTDSLGSALLGSSSVLPSAAAKTGEESAALAVQDPTSELDKSAEELAATMDV